MTIEPHDRSYPVRGATVAYKVSVARDSVPLNASLLLAKECAPLLIFRF